MSKDDQKKSSQVPASPPAPEEKAPGTELAAQHYGTELAVVEIDEEDRGAGISNIDPNERKVPFVRILQTNSPECEEGNTKFMPNAKAGLFINTATKQLYKSLIMIPCARDHKYIEYIPRAIGSGFVGVRKPDDPIVLMLRAKQGKFGKLSYNVTKRDQQGQALDGTEIIESFEVYAIFIDPETGGKFRGIASFSSTQIGKYQALVDRADSFEYRVADGSVVKPPFWAHKWIMTTAQEKNKKGSFKGYVLGLLAKKADGSDDLPIKSFVSMKDPLYAMGKEFCKFVEAGKAEVDYSTAAEEAPKPEDEVEM